MNNCYQCKNSREVPGKSHIKCIKPYADMTGNQHGIKKGWFMYPILFDPVWATTKCPNFETIAVSDPVSVVGKSM